MPYRRTTRELPLASIAEPLASALKKHAEENQLVLDGARAFHTHSENPPATGFFGKLLGRRENPVDPDVTHDSVLVLHSTHLLIATAGEKRGVSALSLALDRASVKRGNLLGVDVGDDGMTLSGLPAEHGTGSYYFGLGPPLADACFGAVESAIRARKNP